MAPRSTETRVSQRLRRAGVEPNGASAIKTSLVPDEVATWV